VDIMEFRGKYPQDQVGTVHGPGYSGGQSIGNKIQLEKGLLSDDFHVYSIEWSPEKIEWFMDGKKYHTVTPETLNGKKWVFDHPHFIILNMAIGGNYGGPIEASTTLPQRVTFDYVRVYKKKE